MSHRIKIRIYYEDTDAANVVYYANYLKFMERARTEFLSELGIDVAEYHGQGCLFPVTHIDVKYKQPARLGDMIEVTTEIKELGNASLIINHNIFKKDALIVEASVKLACIGNDGKPRRIPEEFKKRIPAVDLL
jgi:acyl-CoA thioester hydrolase